MRSQSNELNNNWKGDKVGYSALHRWIRRHLGTPKSCERCGTERAKRYEWANISKKYKRDRGDWVRLCVPCHQEYDNSIAKMVEKRKREGTYKFYGNQYVSIRSVVDVK